MGDNSKGGGLVSAAGSLIGAGINWAATGSMNKKTREFNEKMYGVQRADALADWNMQNTYDSPAQQMARLEAAGVNPNLVFGNGANNTSGPVRSSNAPTWNPRPPQVDAGSVIDKYFDTRIKQQTTNNMELQAKVLEQEALNKAAQTANLGIAGARSSFDLALAQSLKDNTIQMAEANLAGKRANTIFTENQDWRNYRAQDLSIEQAGVAMAKMKADTATSEAQAQMIKANMANAIREGKLKDYEIKLNKMGVTKGDPSYERKLLELFDEIVKPSPSTKKN